MKIDLFRKRISIDINYITLDTELEHGIWEKHIVKIGIEYPSGSGKMRYDSGEFEAISPPNFPKILAMQEKLNKMFPPVPDANPYMINPYAPVAPYTAPDRAPTSINR